jgi:phage portal protein BeeE
VNLLDRVLSRTPTATEAARSDLSFAGYLDLVASAWQQGLLQTTYSTGDKERPPANYPAMIEQVYKANGPIFSLVLARLMVLTEARFLNQEMNDGRPGHLRWAPNLRLLEKPWTNGTTGELLGRMEQDASLAGNFYTAARRGKLRRLRPDQVTIVMGSDEHPDNLDPTDLDAEVIGYLYEPPNGRPVALLPSEVAHYCPIPDPNARFRGMSWVTPVVREVLGDKAANDHKQAFFANAMTPNMAVKFDASVDPDKAELFKKLMEADHQGVANAWKTLFVGGGADVTLLSHTFRDADLRLVQGAGETRMAAAAGVPPVIAGFSEGLGAATYSNYAQARRRFADGTLRPLWRIAAESLATVAPPPSGQRLWYDDSGVAFLREDRGDQVKIDETRAKTIDTLIRAGYKPDSVVDAVESGDFMRLVHTGGIPTTLYPGGKATDDKGGKGPVTEPTADDDPAEPPPADKGDDA